MIVQSPAEFRRVFAALPPPVPKTTLRAAMLVSPIGFRVSEESAADNRYMAAGTAVDIERAFAQHAAIARRLGEIGVPVLIVPGREGLDDAIYPNNVWATTPGRLIVGSMHHPVRRREAKREDVRTLLGATFGYEIEDLSERDCVAELTGCLAIDRSRGVGYCGMTGRVDEAGCEAMHAAFDLGLTFRFDLAPSEYHTNLVLAILAGRACVIHPPSFVDPDAAAAIESAYPDRTLVLSDDEKAAFSGNCIAITERDVLFSATSTRALRPSSIEFLERHGFRVHDVEIDELEKGGGSLRCLIAELF